MPSLNANSEFYTPRLIDNLHDIPYAIFEHLLQPESVLRPKQREACEVVAHKIFEEEWRAIALIMPTSTGKTVIEAQMIEALQQNELIGRSPKKILIITDTKEGVLQTQEKLKLYANINCGLYYSDEKNIDNSVITTTYMSWQSKDFPVDPEDVDLVILDEAHEALTNARLTKLKQHKNAVWLALTASPTYSQERSVLQHFPLGYRMTMKEAVEHGLIASVRNIVLNSNIEVDLDAIRVRGKDLDKRLLSKVINTKARNRIGAEYLLFGRHFDTSEPIRDIRGIVSCSDTRHAEDFARQTNTLYEHFYPGQAPEHGFIRFVSGTTEDRREVLNWHRQGKIKYLSFADLLIQNYDDHGIGICLNLRPTKSWVLATQRGGRPGRLDETNPGKIALIVDVYDKYKGEMKRKNPLLYSSAIGASVLITEEARLIAEKKKVTQVYNVMDRSQVSEVEEFVRNIEFNIVTDEESILALITPDEGDIREKTQDDLSLSEMAKICGLSRETVLPAVKVLLEDWRLYNNEPEKYPHPGIQTEVVKTKQQVKILTISRNDINDFKEKYLPLLKLRLKTEDDLTAYDLVKLTNIGERRIYLVLEKLQKQWEAYEKSKDEKIKPKIKIEMIRNAIGSASASIKREQLEEFIVQNEWNLRNKAEGDISLIDIVKLLNVSNGTVQTGLRRLARDWQRHNSDAEHYPKPDIPLERVRCLNGAISVIPSEFLDGFKEKYLPALDMRFKTEDDLIISDLQKLTKYSKKKINNALRVLKEHWKFYNQYPDKDVKPSVDIEMVRQSNERGAPVLSIRRDQLDIFEDNYLFYKYNLIIKNKAPLNGKGLRKKTEDDVSIQEIVETSSVGKKAVRNRIDKIMAAWKAYHKDSQNAVKPEINVERVMEYGLACDVIPRSQLDLFIRNYLPKIVSEEDYLTGSQLVEKTKIGRSTIGKSLTRIHKEHEAYKADPDNNSKPEVDIEEVFVRSSNGGLEVNQPQWVIKKSQFDLYCKLYLKDVLEAVENFPEKTAQDMASGDILKNTTCSEWSIAKGLNQLKNEWKAYEKDSDNAQKPAIKSYTVRDNNKPVTAIKREDLEKFIEIYMPIYSIKEKTDKDYGAPDIVKITGVHHSTVLKSFDIILKEKEKYEKNKDEKDKPSVDIVRVRRDNNIHWAIPEDQIETYKAVYLKECFLPEKSSTQLTAKEVADLLGLKKSLLLAHFADCRNIQEKNENKNNVIEMQKVKIFRSAKQYTLAFALSVEDLPQFVQKYLPKHYDAFISNKDDIMQRIQRRSVNDNMKPQPE